MSYEDTKEKCLEACRECIEVGILFVKENKNKPKMAGCIQLVNKSSKKCKVVVSDGGSDNHLLQECAKACDESVTECEKYDGLSCQAIVESSRQCRDICNALASASIAL